jgi:ElaB/YqjD/DUF883 family membrane-anchored ribosome-binding protein
MLGRTQNSRYGSAQEIVEIGRLLRELEGHFEHLARSVAGSARHASSTIPEAISDTWSDLADSIRALQERTQGMGREATRVGKEATRVGSDVWHRIEKEVGYRPLLALALAAGVGFLIGALNRR